MSNGALKSSEIVLLEGVWAVFDKIFVNMKKAEEVSSLIRGENPGNGPQEGVCSITERNPGGTTSCLYPLLPEPLIILCISTAWHAALSQKKGLAMFVDAAKQGQCLTVPVPFVRVILKTDLCIFSGVFYLLWRQKKPFSYNTSDGVRGLMIEIPGRICLFEHFQLVNQTCKIIWAHLAFHGLEGILVAAVGGRRVVGKVGIGPIALFETIVLASATFLMDFYALEYLAF